MKTKKYLFIPLLLAMLFSAFFAGPQVKPAFAQAQCVDATGAPIPCPPTADIPCGQPGGPACPPTRVPTEDATRPTKTSLPLANPSTDGQLEGETSANCAKDNPPDSFKVDCLVKLTTACLIENGDVSTNHNDDGSSTVTCSKPVLNVMEMTPLPLVAAPTRTPLPDENYLGSCTNNDRNVFDCFEKFTCEDGLLVIKVDLYSGNGTKYDFYCIPDERVPQLDLPLSIPDPEGKVANWTGGCSAGAGLDACLDLMSAGCAEEGGDVSIWYDDDGGAGVYCENQSEASQPAPEATPLPLVAAPQDGETSDDDWDESCSWASCWAYDLACWSSGGSGYGIEDSAGNTGYHCDMPEGSTEGNNLKQLGLATMVGLVLIGLLVPASNKVRDAAAKRKSARMPNNKNPELVKNQEDDSTETAKATLYGRKSGDDKRGD